MSARTGSLPPPDLRVRLADRTIVRENGRRVAGGAPFRLLRLTDPGAAQVCRWAGAGDVVGEPHAARRLARRLLDYGLLVSDSNDATCRPEPGRPASFCPDPACLASDRDVPVHVDVVVPVHDRPDQLKRCLASLVTAGAHVVVVDDGSSDPAAIADAACRHGAQLVRLDSNRGASAARNAGLTATQRPFIAFIDSDVTVEPGCLSRLLAHFADPLVGLAAPRVLPARPDQRGWVAGYEQAHSPLDMGRRAGNAGPVSHIPYLVSAALMARREALGSGFPEELRVGEDVDLCWRVGASGWRAVYDPAAGVRHDHRLRLGPLLRRRWTYGCSIGLLARRHPGALVPVRANAFTLAALLSAAAERPVLAAALLVGRGLGLRKRIGGDAVLTAALMSRDLWFTTAAVARAVRRTWTPALVLAAPFSRRARRTLALALAFRLTEPDRLRPQHLPLAALDDSVAALALWYACVRYRVLDPLVPQIRR